MLPFGGVCHIHKEGCFFLAFCIYVCNFLILQYSFSFLSFVLYLKFINPDSRSMVADVVALSQLESQPDVIELTTTGVMYGSGISRNISVCHPPTNNHPEEKNGTAQSHDMKIGIDATVYVQYA